jgi:hypothetical protein
MKKETALKVKRVMADMEELRRFTDMVNYINDNTPFEVTMTLKTKLTEEADSEVKEETVSMVYPHFMNNDTREMLKCLKDHCDARIRELEELLDQI